MTAEILSLPVSAIETGSEGTFPQWNTEDTTQCKRKNKVLPIVQLWGQLCMKHVRDHKTGAHQMQSGAFFFFSPTSKAHGQ